MQFSPKGGNEMAQVSSDDAKRAKAPERHVVRHVYACQPRVKISIALPSGFCKGGA